MGRLVLAGWLCACVGLLAVTAFGPRLWARQGGENASHAAQVAAIGQAIVFVVGWPIWSAAGRTALIGIVLSGPAFVLLAATMEPPEPRVAIELAGRIAVVLAVPAAARAVLLRRPRIAQVAWIVLLVWTLGLPTLALLSEDYGRQGSACLRFSLPSMTVTTFFH